MEWMHLIAEIIFRACHNLFYKKWKTLKINYYSDLFCLFLSDAQGLLLAVCAEIILNGVQGIVRGVEDQTLVGHMKGKHFIHCIIVLVPQDYF